MTAPAAVSSGTGAPTCATPTAGALRWVRGTVVGATAWLLAVGAHLLATPTAAPSRAVLGVLLLAVVGSVALSGQRWSLPELVGVLLGAQVVAHLAMAGAAGHDHAAMHASPGLAAPGWSMVLAHGAAAAATALLLRRGEAVCWWLAGLLTDRIERAGRLVESHVLTFELGARRLLTVAHNSTPALFAVANPLRGPPATR